MRLDLVDLAHWAKAKAAKGQKVFLPSGLSDVFNVIKRHGARGNAGLVNRLASEGINTLQRSNRCQNFDNLALFILANTDLKTRTFSLNGGTQKQVAEKLGVSQATVSRILSLMISMRVIRHAFCGDNKVNDPKSGLVKSQDGLNLNNIYYVCDDFGYLAGQTAGDKLVKAFNAADERETKKGLNLHSRLLVIRNTLWEQTIANRARQISKGCLKTKLQKVQDRSVAANIIMKRAQKRGELINRTEQQITAYINVLLNSCGFSSLTTA